MNKTKKRNPFWAKIIWGFFIILVSTMIAIWISGYTFIYKTLIYTYPDIDDINLFDTRTVTDSAGIPWTLSTSYNKTKLNENTEATLTANESVAYLVIKNDSIVHEEYWDHASANTLSNSFSVAKSIVGLLTGIAHDEGYFSLDDSVGKYLPEFSEGRNGTLKIRHLLQMSSGLNWDESYSSLFSKTTEAYYGDDLKHQVLKLKVIKDPGTVFEYMSCNTVLLSLIINKTTGKSISEFASEKLWMPIHATQPAYWSLDHNDGIEKSYCCFYSSARDFAKVGKLVLDSGRWEGKQIVSKEFLNEMLTPNMIKDQFGASTDYYGLQWWMMDHKGHKVYYARGILGQYIAVIPDEQIIMVRLGHKRGQKVGNHYDDLFAYLDGALE